MRAMKGTVKDDPLLSLVDKYYEEVRKAYRMSGIDRELAKKSIARAGLLALKIQALRFRN